MLFRFFFQIYYLFLLNSLIFRIFLKIIIFEFNFNKLRLINHNVEIETFTIDTKMKYNLKICLAPLVYWFTAFSFFTINYEIFFYQKNARKIFSQKDKWRFINSIFKIFLNYTYVLLWILHWIENASHTSAHLRCIKESGELRRLLLFRKFTFVYMIRLKC